MESGIFQGRRQVKQCGVDTYGELADRESIQGSGGEALSGVQGQAPMKLKNLVGFGGMHQICFILRILQTL